MAPRRKSMDQLGREGRRRRRRQEQMSNAQLLEFNVKEAKRQKALRDRTKAEKQREAEMRVKMQNQIIRKALGYENPFAAYQKIVRQSRAKPGVHELSVQLSKFLLKPNAEYHSELGKEKKLQPIHTISSTQFPTESMDYIEGNPDSICLPDNIVSNPAISSNEQSNYPDLVASCVSVDDEPNDDGNSDLHSLAESATTRNDGIDDKM